MGRRDPRGDGRDRFGGQLQSQRGGADDRGGRFRFRGRGSGLEVEAHAGVQSPPRSLASRTGMAAAACRGRAGTEAAGGLAGHGERLLARRPAQGGGTASGRLIAALNVDLGHTGPQVLCTWVHAEAGVRHGNVSLDRRRPTGPVAAGVQLSRLAAHDSTVSGVSLPSHFAGAVPSETNSLSRYGCRGGRECSWVSGRSPISVPNVQPHPLTAVRAILTICKHFALKATAGRQGMWDRSGTGRELRP
jgi:hypothetical protein